MGLDSTANLLFTIGADSSDAQNNIQRFRGLLSKDLAAMQAEFSDWSKKVLGDLSTPGGMFAAMGASVAAAGVVIGASLLSAAGKAATYALEIEEASDRTGIGAENMSRLRYAADMTRTSYSGLVGGLTKFASTLDAARDPASKQAEIFHRLGISQKEVEAGSRDMLPLLYRVSDAFRDDMTAVERTAVARQLFSRGGAELVEMLSRGSGALRQFGDEADRLGLVIGEDSVEAAKRYRAEVTYLKASFEGLAVSIGKAVLPALNNLVVGGEAIWGGLKKAIAGGLMSPAAAANFAAGVVVAGTEAAARLDAAAKASLASRMGLEAPGEEKDKTAKSRKDFEGLSNILDQVRGRLAEFGTEEEQVAFETSRMQAEVDKAARKLAELNAAGEDTAETFRRETQALAVLPQMIDELAATQMRAILNQRYTDKMTAEARMLELEEKGQKARIKLAETEAARLQEIAAKRNAEYAGEMQTLQQNLLSALAARMTVGERLRAQYEQDLQRFARVEDAKAWAVAEGEAKQQAVRELYDASRQAALATYQAELNQLVNSTGWRGVFGEEFGQAIRGNEQLSREWAESSDQATLMVRVATETMAETGRQAFKQFAAGMGAAAAESIIYGKSFGAAMREATTQALASLSAQCIAYAIYSTALGFLRLAEWLPGSAAAAFKAAALFGTGAVTAAVVGRAIAPQQAGAGGAAGASEGSSGSGAAAGASGGSSEREGPRVVIYIQGPVVGASGIEELTDMINEAVEGRDVRLVASVAKQFKGLLT